MKTNLAAVKLGKGDSLNYVGDLVSPYSSLLDNILNVNNKIIIIPSFVDVHVHLREPGFFYKETIKTGTLAAAKSGYSTVFSMPNLKPVPDTLKNLKQQLDIIDKDAVIDVIPYGSITMDEKGRELSDMEDMAPFVVGFSDDGVGVASDSVMKKAMLKAKELNKIIVAHCEDMDLRGDGYIHDGEYARRNRHKGISSVSEWAQIERDLTLVKEIGCKYHVCHISTKESVELIRRAKAEGLSVTCETAPHYLVLNDMNLQDDGRFKMNPPIRSEEDRNALIKGLLDGTIDMIATDHAPHTAEEKEKGLKDSAMGITGLETAFPILYTKLVKPGIISIEKLIELMAINPRKRFGLPMPDKTCDFAIWDIGTVYKIKPERFVSMGKSTPFSDWKVQGRCLLNVKNGKIVWQTEL